MSNMLNCAEQILMIHECMYTQVYTKNMDIHYGKPHFIASYTSRRLPYP